jgi:hypothetical protein
MGLQRTVYFRAIQPNRLDLHRLRGTGSVLTMSIDPRVALQSLTSALEEHLAASASRRGDEDPAVETAYLAIIDAFEVYEEVLYDTYHEVTPLVIYDEDDDEDEEEADELDRAEGEDLDPIND